MLRWMRTLGGRLDTTPVWLGVPFVTSITVWLLTRNAAIASGAFVGVAVIVALHLRGQR